jgi:hypothetical protein
MEKLLTGKADSEASASLSGAAAGFKSMLTGRANMRRPRLSGECMPSAHLVSVGLYGPALSSCMQCCVKPVWTGASHLPSADAYCCGAKMLAIGHPGACVSALQGRKEACMCSSTAAKQRRSHREVRLCVRIMCLQVRLVALACPLGWTHSARWVNTCNTVLTACRCLLTYLLCMARLN